ncbi:hypothetical protein [Mycolicibacterium pyrenivorans]|uniref:hypothetical protein n=1 Tax=Mycolicibacterium pyrenivorans TaxID=187102 RepID=UPI0021F2A78A|nr:hypothetical protein [Mycolicibacterium pyrenivorans]MCV7151975.1 hypothetical protein [Mycolicibacterium pyrenivorans]
MSAVLGLSLTADDVVWALVDADGALLDHDALDVDPAGETACAAARGACAIARAIGVEIGGVRLTWKTDAAHDGLGLRTRLEHLGFDHVEAVPTAAAMAAPVHPDAMDMAPRLALAYGAARAEVDPGDTQTVAVPEPRRGRARRRVVTAVLSAAVAAGLGVLLLSAEPAPRIEPATAIVTAEQATPADPGWVAVAAPSATAATDRKVVVTPVPVQEPAVVSPQFYEPVQQPVAAIGADPAPEVAAVAAEPAPAALLEAAPDPGQASSPASAELPHLPETHLSETHLAAATDPAAAPLPGPDMTEMVNVFTALP